jgi:hypothetical protein
MMRSAVEFELTYGELHLGELEGAAPAERCTALARLKNNFGDARKRGTLQPSLDGAAKRTLVTDGRLLTPKQMCPAWLLRGLTTLGSCVRMMHKA